MPSYVVEKSLNAVRLLLSLFMLGVFRAILALIIEYRPHVEL